MIDKVEFTAKNLTSNAGVLPLLNYTEEQDIFQELNEILVFDNKSTEEIKMYTWMFVAITGLLMTRARTEFRLSLMLCL